jgi:cyanophycinase-like exopeptidase
MMTAWCLLLAALATPTPLQGPVAIIDATPAPDSALEADVEALLEGVAPLRIELGLEGSSELDREDVVILGRGDLEGADSRALSERVREAPAVLMEGGSLLAWHETLYMARRPTRLVHALSRHSREGRAIIGVGGAGAALAGGGIVKSAELKEVLRNPRRAYELQARVALGWGPPALVDADSWGGEPVRTLRIMERSYMAQAAHLGPGSGLVLLPRHKQVKVLGEGGVAFFETAPGRRNRHDLRKGSLSLLTRGDVWELAHGKLTPDPLAEMRPSPHVDFEQALRGLAADPPTRTSLECAWGYLLLRQRDDTRLIGPEDALRPIRAEFDLLKSP